MIRGLSGLLGMLRFILDIVGDLEEAILRSFRNGGSVVAL